MNKTEEFFEFTVTKLGTVTFEGNDYNYEVEISGGMDCPTDYEVQILEHGLSEDLYQALKSKVVRELDKCKVRLIYE